ncbi:MAG: hydrogen peroxide-inducible genes activator [Alphaproteobacteria bacterium]
MIRPTIRQMEYIVALDDKKSFIDAAERCNVTQSTISAGIKELETILEQPLFIRGRKNITLTALGEETAERARQILNATDRIISRAQESKSPLSSTLRLGIIPTIAPYFLPEILPRLQKDFPKLELEIYEDFSDRIGEKLRQGTIDVAIMAFPYDMEDIEIIEFFEEPFFLACPKGKEPAGMVMDAKNLDFGALLLLEDGHCLTDHALSACDLQKSSRRKAYSASSLPTLIEMVNHGLGITLLPDMAVKAGNLPKNIDIHPFRSPTPGRKIGLARKENSPKYQDTQMLYHTIMDYLKSTSTT